MENEVNTARGATRCSCGNLWTSHTYFENDGKIERVECPEPNRVKAEGEAPSCPYCQRSGNNAAKNPRGQFAYWCPRCVRYYAETTPNNEPKCPMCGKEWHVGRECEGTEDVQRWFHSLLVNPSDMNERWCDRCNTWTYSGRMTYHYRGNCTPDSPELSLSLLVVDAGECCFLRVEQGRLDTKILPNEIGGLGYRILPAPFAAVRSAIDASAEPPVPRIEKIEGYFEEDPDVEMYDVFFNPERYSGHDVIGKAFFDTFCQLAGKPLPIWEGGEWKQLVPFYLNDMYQGGSVTNASWIDGGSGIAVWRYTK